MEKIEWCNANVQSGKLNSQWAWLGYPGGAEEDFPGVLSKAADDLFDQGAEKIIGPLNHSTWNAYRLVTESDGSPPFFLESPQLFQDPAPWMQAGFHPRYGYRSTKLPLQTDNQRTLRAEQRLSANGITLRTIRLEAFESELRAVYTLSLQAFARNLFYTPCTEGAFLQMYLPFKDKVNPEWIRIAETDSGVCGYLFAVPDARQAQRGEPVRDIILKTLAVLPGRRFAGLGAVLVNQLQRSAADQGFTHAIHALMYEGNVSSNIGKDARVIRRYHLFEKNREPQS